MVAVKVRGKRKSELKNGLEGEKSLPLGKARAKVRVTYNSKSTFTFLYEYLLVQANIIYVI